MDLKKYIVFKCNLNEIMQIRGHLDEFGQKLPIYIKNKNVFL